MKQQLSTATPNVLIGINSINFDMKRQLNYRAIYQPTPQFGTLSFKVLASDNLTRWRRIQFNFLASNHPHLLSGTLQFNSLQQATNKTKHTLISPIQVQDSFKTKPLIQAYICGITLRSKMSQSDLQASLKQIDSLKRFSWNINLVNVINQMIITQSILKYQITSAQLTNNSLTVQVTYTQSVVISSITISYLIVNSIQFPLQNNYLLHAYSLSSSNISYSFQPLQNTEMTFIGLRGLQHKVNLPLTVQFIVSNNNNKFTINPTPIPLADSLILMVNDFQMNMKYQNQCINCPDSTYRYQSYCLNSCPRGFVNVDNSSNSSCRYCNISQFLIPNQDTQQCECAKQYFVDAKSGACTSCLYSCLTCANSNTCSTCDNNDKTTKRIFNPLNKMCTCVDGFWDDKDNQKLNCQPCHYSCSTCSGESIYQCVKCQGSRVFDSTKKCQCATNFVEENGDCVCKEPNTLLNGACYSKTVSSSIVCTKPYMIQTTLPNNQKSCICQPNFFMYQNQCISCPFSFTLNNSTGKCQCPVNTYLTSDDTCVSCESMKYYDAKFEKCLCKKQYFEKQDGSCIDCPDKSTYTGGKCQCVFNYYLKNNVCIKCSRTSDDPNCLRIEEL